MSDVYKGRVGISWDAMQRHLRTKGRAALTEAEVAVVLEELPSVYPSGRLSTQRLSETLSQWLPYMGARYGSDVRRTAEPMLSAFTETVSRIPSILDRQTIALNFLPNLQSFGLSERDALMLHLDMLNEAGNGQIVWEAEITPRNTIIVRSRLNR